MKSKTITQFQNQLQSDIARSTRTPGNWRQTVIHETRTSALTDPLRGDFFGRSNYDQLRNFPTGDDIPRRTAKLIKRLERIAERHPSHRSRGRRQSVAFDRTAQSLFREYLPDRNERVHDARARLERDLANKQRNSRTWPAWAKLRNYFSRFRESARVSQLDRDVVDAALKELVANSI